MLIDEAVYLDHHGVKGMRWGIRKKNDASGLSRPRRALLERNQRLVEFHQKAISRTGTKTFNAITGIDKVLMGKKLFEKSHNQGIANLNHQSERIKAGKFLARDMMSIPLSTIFIEVKPK